MGKRADFVIRLVTFLIGVVAIFGLAGGGVWYLLHAGSTSPSPATPPAAVYDGTPPAEVSTQSGWKHRLEGFYLDFYRAQLSKPAGDDPSPIPFVVAPGETPAIIAQNLQKAALITDAGLFLRLVSYMGVGNKMQAGTFELRATMTMSEIVEALQHGREEEITITLPEGLRAEEIAALLAKRGLVDAGEFMAAVRAGQDDALAPGDRPAGTTLEGYLFPDTYRVVAGKTNAASMVKLLSGTFAQRFDVTMHKQATGRGLSVFQTVILASIVEREAVVPTERPTIAGVFINRWKDSTVLNADPTVQYALGYQAGTGEWWKRPLLLDDLKIDSPYNTYLYAGLPPGPICNPGLASLQAVLTAPPTPYYYFVARGDGTHAFAKTLEEHKANVQRYQSGN